MVRSLISSKSESSEVGRGGSGRGRNPSEMGRNGSESGRGDSSKGWEGSELDDSVRAADTLSLISVT